MGGGGRGRGRSEMVEWGRDVCVVGEGSSDDEIPWDKMCLVNS